MSRRLAPTSPAPALARLAAACALATLAPLASAAVLVTNMGQGMVTDVSADGNAAVGMNPGNYGTWRWTAGGGQVQLGRSPYPKLHSGGGVPAISADGSVVAATILDDTGTHATEGRWTVSGGWQQLTPPLPADGGVMDSNDSDVFGMSRDGNVVTGLYWRPGYSGGSAHGSWWSAATHMVGLPTLGGSSRVDDANGDGSVLVGWEESPNTGARLAVVWVHGVRTFLDGGADDAMGEASKVNTAGTVIVGQSWDAASGRNVAARWTWNGSGWTRTLLGVLAGGRASAMSYALGVSDDGNVIVGMDRDKSMVFTSRGFVWTPDAGMVDFQSWVRSQGFPLSDWLKVSQVSAVTPDGRVLFAVGSEQKAPYGTRSVRVERVDAAAKR